MRALQFIFFFFFLATICVSLSRQQSVGGCGQRCDGLNTCASRLACRFGECSDDPTLGALKCSGCTPFKSQVYNATSRCDECCVPARVYDYYNCSPAFSEVNRAWLTVTNFDRGDGGPAKCTQQYYSSTGKFVAMATGWYSERRFCGELIRIATYNRSVVAQIVHECGSNFGCNEDSGYYQPCRPDSVDATDGVWQGLGVTNESEQFGGMDVTWSFVNLPNPPPGTNVNRGKSSLRNIAIACASGALFLVLLSALFAVSCRYHRLRRKNKELLSSLQLDNQQGALLPRKFKFNEIAKATNNFTKKLGEGGFGSVFMGTLPGPCDVAVKRMDKSNQGSQQFKTEVMSIGSIHHLNLIRLRGYCIHSPMCLLVYDYMPNSSLDKWIFRKDGKPPLAWRTRFSICLDVARGLCYLHEGCSERILHLDIKPQNILLDEQLRAKISDFGLAKLIGRDTSGVVTVMRGTPGYMAPEWLHSRITDKTDVYSFGMVLLETVACRKAIEIQSNSSQDSSDNGVRMLREEAFQSLAVGEPLCGLLPANEVLEAEQFEEAERLVRIAGWCIQQEPSVRPSMGIVVKMLEGVLKVEDPPL